ncbi:acyl-CoA-binding domain-containing protein 4 isoform X2 [Oenanthe melanoleuca]|uniref:acyl-CoA-binding domain-containing protein 4 isoform X2 n=1 Tax=Oenanthe melanoleuca TaxID=2939378 RepID=UPI0024C1A062|nr:acyl-CoA-binding domain-containing protein 4 isoform X2 [Oenanthe melanoleuca]
MEEPGCGAQFRAAVQVIQGLPRSGAYRPSYEEMLRFYSYYKQATAGCCQGPRPGFWDPIGRYKWDAWHSLGRMSKEEAMAAYVAEMKKVAQKVIDTVPMDESTEEMFRYFEPLYEVIHDMPRPPESFFRRRGESQGRPDGPSQDVPASSPALESPRDSVPGEQQDGPGAGLAPAPEGSQVTSDTEGDTFCDTLEQMEPEKAGQGQGLTPNGAQAGAEPPVPHSAGQGERGEGRRAEGSSSTDLTALGSERAPAPGSWSLPGRVCPSLCPQVSGWQGGPPAAPPSWRWPRGWRRTWPARCGRCRRSCGGCGSGSAAWRRSAMPRRMRQGQTRAQHLLHRRCLRGT